MNSIVGDVAHKKHTALALEVSLKNMCFHCCYCKRFAASVALTGSMPCAQSRRRNAFIPIVNTPRVNRPTVRSPIAALHRAWTAVYTGTSVDRRIGIGLLGAGGCLQQ